MEIHKHLEAISNGATLNSAGGVSFAVDIWGRFQRFLILGSEGGSYYASEIQLTLENAKCVLECVKEDGRRAVDLIVEISDSGRAPKNDPALFALALAASYGDELTKKYALASLTKVARIATHLYIFVDHVQKMRGWGRGLRNAVSNWYNTKDAEQLAVQLVKYRNRSGWSHRDILRLASPKPATEVHNALYRWVVSKEFGTREVSRGENGGSVKTSTYSQISPDLLPQVVKDFEAIQIEADIEKVVAMIAANRSITWEMLPTEMLAHSQVWKALLPNLPFTAMLRNLARMTANGTLKPLAYETSYVVSRLLDEKAIAKSRVHPIAILSALNTYRSGHGLKGSLSWEPVTQIVDALDQAFYISFGNVTPTLKSTLLALDVSGSMTWGEVAGVPGLSPRVASAAMALVTAHVEPRHAFVGFSHELINLNISSRMRLDTVIDYLDSLPFGGTDCALPMLHAVKNNLSVDTFVVYTDNETWYGDVHPWEALKMYRRKTGIPAKLVVVGMVANEFTIAEPSDSGMLDIVGFDTASPQLISDFSST